jgi:hypothetical protein
MILVPERTSAVWYQELEISCDLMIHLNKRLPFLDQYGENHRQFPIGTHLM